MKCPYCKTEMIKGRITVLDKAVYNFYPEECFDSFIKKIKNKVIITEKAIRLDKPNITNIFGSEICNCFYCEKCKKVIIDMV